MDTHLSRSGSGADRHDNGFCCVGQFVSLVRREVVEENISVTLSLSPRRLPSVKKKTPPSRTFSFSLTRSRGKFVSRAMSAGACARARRNDGERRRTTRTTTVGGDSAPAASSAPSSRRRAESRSPPNRILLVHGLDVVSVNCDRVFNLFCLYGNVSAVKILRDDKVLVEMKDVEAAKRCVSNLHMLPLDDANRMRVKYSKHCFMSDYVIFNQLPDGTPTQKVYLTSKLNRFPASGMCLDRRRIAAPSKVLHFFNAPTDVCGRTIHKTVSDNLRRTDAISSITILPKRSGAKCSTGLIELKTVALATRAVLLSNHMMFGSTKSNYPFLTKLCFSKWSDVRRMSADSATLRFSCASSMPWLLHKSELAVSVTEYPILSSTVVDGGDCSWTLWEVKNEAAAAVEDVAAGRVAAHEDLSAGRVVGHEDLPAKPPTECQQWRRRQQSSPPRNPDGIDRFLLDMLRSRLCSDTDDQGDVFYSPVQSEDEDAASATVRMGPLGDA